jgi:hypothetical protein
VIPRAIWRSSFCRQSGDDIFAPNPKGSQLQTKSKKKLHNVTVEFPNGSTKLVKVKAANVDAAEQRALKFNPSATGIKR